MEKGDEEFVVIRAGPPLPIRRARKSVPITLEGAESWKGGSGMGATRPPSPFPSAPLPSNGPKGRKGTPPPGAGERGLWKGGQDRNPSTCNFTKLLPCRKKKKEVEVESKVRQYILKVKESDEMHRSVRGRMGGGEGGVRGALSLEDLYQIPVQVEELMVGDKVRETLRLVKEKEEVIKELRHTCHQLKLKWADAENRVDQMRFAGGRTSGPPSQRRTGRGEESLPQPDHSHSHPLLHQNSTNWLEKVEKWQSDSKHNVSGDSCGDRDSGFRGSAELEASPILPTAPTPSRRPSRHSKTKSDKKCERSTKSLVSSPHPLGDGKGMGPERGLQLGSMTGAAECPSGPSSLLEIAQPWHTFATHLNPQSGTEYEGFPAPGTTPTTSFSSRRTYFETPPDSIDHRHLLSTIERDFRSLLHPLLDDATCSALRVNTKSQGLVTMLQAKNSS